MLELASLRELAGKYQSIETTLIDKGCLLLATERVDGVAFCDVILHNMFAKGFTRVAITQCSANINGTEERRAMLSSCRANLTEIRIFKDFNFVHNFRLF